MGDTIFSSKEGEGRIGGDVVLGRIYDRRSLRRCRKKNRRTCYRLLGIPHTGPSEERKSVREHPLFQKETQGIAERACWSDGEGTCPTEPWSGTLLPPWYSVEAGTDK